MQALPCCADARLPEAGLGVLHRELPREQAIFLAAVVMVFRHCRTVSQIPQRRRHPQWEDGQDPGRMQGIFQFLPRPRPSCCLLAF